MKIAHAADWHIGKGRERDSVTFGCIEKFFEICETEKVDLIVHCAEVFEKALLNAQPDNSLYRLIEILKAHPAIPIDIISGTPSHDVPGSLDLLKTIPNIRVHTKPEIVSRETIGGSVIYICIPEPQKSELIQKARPDQVEGVFAAGLYNLVKELGKNAGDRAIIESAGSSSPPVIVIGHLTISGAQVSSGYSLHAAIAPDALLELSGADAVMLGHVHQAQTFSEGKIRYAGSPNWMDFGEKEDSKGFWIWEFEGTEIKDVVFHMLPGRRLITVDARINEPIKMIPDGAEIKIQCPVDQKELAEEIKEDWFTHYNPHSVFIEWLPVEKLTRPRSEKINQPLTLTEEVEEWGEVNSVQITDRIKKKVTVLEEDF